MRLSPLMPTAGAYADLSCCDVHRHESPSSMLTKKLQLLMFELPLSQDRYRQVRMSVLAIQPPRGLAMHT
jgi:hypothetical protein